MKKIILFASVLLLNSLSVTALPGDFVSPGAMATSSQSNGKLIMGGQMTGPDDKIVAALKRYNTNNELDQTFGNGGMILIPVGSESTISLVEPLADDKVEVTGFAYSVDGLTHPDLEFTAHVNSDGTLDYTYGNSGLEVSPIKK